MVEVTVETAIEIAKRHHDAQRFPEASWICEKILDILPDHPEALYLLGKSRFFLGRYEEAIAPLRKSIMGDGNNARAYMTLGDALKATDASSKDVMMAYQRAVSLEPDDIRYVSRLSGAIQAHAVRGFSTPHGEISFSCIDLKPFLRAATLSDKEPETLEWIETFEPGDIFWDIGANVGAYTLYAAKAGKASRILAFEPAAGNYMILNDNIRNNGFDGFVTAYCIAFSDRESADRLHMQDVELGGAMASFGERIDYSGETFSPRFSQGMIGFSVDGFIGLFDPPFPNHLKIDVDGIEDRIVMGASRTLADPRVRSLSIELDDGRPAYRDSVVARIEAAGLRYVSKRHAAMYDDGDFASIYNFRFVRP